MEPVKYLYVYIIRCSDNSYYTGVTNNLERRLEEHNIGINIKCYTYQKRPVISVYHEQYADFDLAINWEKRIKNWSRKKKEALIDSKWEKLKIEAECKNETSHKFLG